MSRPSPTVSATSVDPYSLGLGNDNNIWCNMKSGSSFRWVKICSQRNNGSVLTNINLKLIYEIQHSIKKKKQISFSLIGTLPISDCLAFGDTVPTKLSKFNHKKYFIYRYDTNLIASPKSLSSLNSLFKEKFYTSTKYSVPVDTGSFVFYDYKIIKNYNKLLKKQSKKSLSVPIRPPIDYSSKTSTVVYKVKNMSIKKDIRINKKLDMTDKSYQSTVFGDEPDKIVIIDGSNGYGDGSFGLMFNHKNNIVIQCSPFITCLFDTIIDVVKNKKIVPLKNCVY